MKTMPERKSNDEETGLLMERLDALNQRFSEIQHAGRANGDVGRILQTAFEEMSATLEELRVAEEELRVQNEELLGARLQVEAEWARYLDLFESAPDAYLVTDLQGVVQEANRAAEMLLGRPARFLVRKPLASLVPLEDRTAFRQWLLALAEAPNAAQHELRLKNAGGGLRECLATVTVVHARGGAPSGLRWLIRDAGPQSQAEAERYRQLVEEVQDYAILMMDPLRRIVHWNTGATKILGYSREEIIGQSGDILFTPEDRENGAPAAEQAQATAEGRAEDERWHLRRDGSRFWGSGVLTAFRDGSGAVRWYAKVLRDMTARRQEQERLAADFAREHRIAETFQRQLLPDLSRYRSDRLSLAAFYEAAWDEARVGGDFYDAFALDLDTIALVVGDVSGKGLTAAAHGAEIKSVLRVILRESASPAQSMARLNAFLCDSQRLNGALGADLTDVFVTLTLCVLNCETGEARVAVAGAEPVLHISGGEAAPVPAQGKLLGVEPQEQYTESQLLVAPGDTLALVTDGFTEARRDGEFLDYAGLVALAQNAQAAPTLQEMGRAILEQTRAFAGGALHDDACLVLARRL